MIRLPQICLNFLDFPHRLGVKEILWGKRNFGDCKRIFEQAVVEALCSVTLGHIKKNSWLASSPAHKRGPRSGFIFIFYFKKKQLLLINRL
jgi:hypothetical protein